MTVVLQGTRASILDFSSGRLLFTACQATRDNAEWLYTRMAFFFRVVRGLKGFCGSTRGVSLEIYMNFRALAAAAACFLPLQIQSDDFVICSFLLGWCVGDYYVSYCALRRISALFSGVNR